MSDTNTAVQTIAQPSSFSLPFLWPMQYQQVMIEKGIEVAARNMKFLNEEMKLEHDLKPTLATPNAVRLNLRTMTLREYGSPVEGGIPTLVDAPHAGHTAVIADYHKGQSLIETLMANGHPHVLLTDWKSATPDMANLEVDNYLEEMLAVIEDLGGKVNLIGLCQGGWVSAMIAARFPDKVNSLVLAGAPIDTNAGDGPIKKMAQKSPMSFYEEMVAASKGLMPGRFMLQGWKNMHPEQHYFKNYIELYENIDDAAYLSKEETFESWYENPIDLPGRWYLQVIGQLFKENRFANGEFVGLGRVLKLSDITCPTYLLAGADDDITTPEQVLAAEQLIGTPAAHIQKKTVPGGHIGLFMGSRTLRDYWPEIAQWVARQ